MSPRVCLIVDNPNRDLAGLSITAAELARRGIETHLVPMYDQLQHIVDIKPDLVVLNFIREHNSQLINLYHSMGIKLCILDTEGAIYFNVDEVVRNLDAQFNDLKKIGVYMTWGSFLQDTFSEAFNDKCETKFVATGVPRTDFYHPDCLNSLQPCITEPYVLLPTNHSIVNSKFQSASAEVENFRRVLRNSHEIWQQRLDVFKRNWEQISEIYENLFETHPSKNFVIRPHPFEDQTYYEQRFGHYPNAYIMLDDNLESWLFHAKAVVHLNCSTGLEGAMMGKTNISFDWLQNDLVKMPSVDSVSLKAKSMDELHEAIDAVWEQAPLPTALEKQRSQVQENLDGIITNWFYAIDGDSHKRVADIISQELALTPPGKITIGFTAQKTLLYQKFINLVGSVYFHRGERRRDKISRRNRKAFEARDALFHVRKTKANVQPDMVIGETINTASEVYRSSRAVFKVADSQKP